jgi:ADP-ribose pyrophosphatase
VAGKIELGDEVIYEGHVAFVKRPYRGKNYDVVVSRDAAIMLYIDLEDNVYFSKQFRPAIGQEVLELPAETLDKPNLSPLETMLEGMVEECGIQITKNQVEELGYVFSTDGHDTERVHMFLAHGPNKYVGQRLEDLEKIKVVKLPFDEAYQMAIRNELHGSKSNFLILHEKLKRLGEFNKPERDAA